MSNANAANPLEQALREINSPTTLGGIIDRMTAVRDERRQIAARDKVLVEEYTGLEEQLIALFKQQGTEMGSSKVATATMSVTPIPVVEDWDAFYAYMRENDALHLLQRRPGVGAMNELKDAGVDMPGVRWIDKESISLRAK